MWGLLAQLVECCDTFWTTYESPCDSRHGHTFLPYPVFGTYLVSYTVDTVLLRVKRSGRKADHLSPLPR